MFFGYKLHVVNNILGAIASPLVFPEFGGPGGSPPLFFPTEMNFQEMYDFSSDMFEFDLLYRLENELFTPFESNESFRRTLRCLERCGFLY